ncbi:Uncharacterized protein FWK35_00010089 [Aphis craccivora]|uniref:Uncharacterized protein n=1 Tax=Aphis craccivora TaxID=307492 RepID=A0A6G0YFQ0_APHCR|nr:Uncharacterized protein FWK35_00010089 [Aphis craccivora]
MSDSDTETLNICNICFDVYSNTIKHTCQSKYINTKSSDEDVSDNSFVDDSDADPDFNLNLSDDSDLNDNDTFIIPIIQTPTQTEPNWGPVSENVSSPVFNE